MNKLICTSVFLALSLAMLEVADARNVKYLLSIEDAMKIDATTKPDGSVKFFFANQSTPQISKKMGSISVHEKVSTRPERDENSCRLAFLEALVELQKKAHRMGADAVVNIVSFFRRETNSSPTEFQCHAGASAHVMLRGEFVQLAP